MSITPEQLADVRADAGDTGGEVFSDAEIERLWERVSGAKTTAIRHDATLALMYRQLRAKAANLHDIQAGATNEKLSQVFKHLQDLYEELLPALEDALGMDRRQAAMGRLRAIPRQGRRKPHEGG
jgi:hypothetical protein